MSGIKITNRGPARSTPDSDSVDGVVDVDGNVDWDPPTGGIAELDQWKQPVRVATTASITIATSLNAGDSIDGVTLVAGDRVLVKDQSSSAQNGIYVAGATPARASDMDEDDEVLGALVYVITGTTNAGTAWAVDLTAAPDVDTDPITWAAFGGGTGGAGSLALDDLSDVTITAPADGDLLTYDSGSGDWVNAASGTPSAGDIAAGNGVSGLPGTTVQDQLDELASAVGWGPDVMGSVSLVAGQITIVDDATWNEFPGAVALTPTSILLVFNGNGTGHTTDGQVCGLLLTLGEDRRSIDTIGTKFTIVDDAEDLRCEDGVAIVHDEDGVPRLTITYRPYDGSDNHDPAFIICDDAPGRFTESSGWGAPIAIPISLGSANNKTDGHVERTADGAWYVPVEYDNSDTDRYVGLWRWTGSLDDPSGGSFKLIGHDNTKHYSELSVTPLNDDGDLLALLRCDALSSTRKAYSTDFGVTWGAITDAHDGHGHPTCRKGPSGILVTAYRDSPNGHNKFRTSSDDGATWSAETSLTTTGTRDAYDAILWTTPNDILVVGGVEYSVGGVTGTADLFAWWLTDSTTYIAAIPEPEAEAHIADASDAHDASAVSADTTGYVNSSASDVQGVLDDFDGAIASAAASGGSGDTDHFHVIEAFNGDASTTVFTIADAPIDPDAVFAFVGGSLTAVTVSGTDSTTITFGSAPGSGTANVVIHYPAVVAA